MQLAHAFALPHVPARPGPRVLLLASGGECGSIALRLGRLGADVEVRGEIYTALSEILDDPLGIGLFVIDCDILGEPEAMAKALGILSETRPHLPVILISRSFLQQSFPHDSGEPVKLRAPLSAVSLKVGYEHALRDRLDLTA